MFCERRRARFTNDILINTFFDFMLLLNFFIQLITHLVTHYFFLLIKLLINFFILLFINFSTYLVTHKQYFMRLLIHFFSFDYKLFNSSSYSFTYLLTDAFSQSLTFFLTHPLLFSFLFTLRLLICSSS